jgi:hypothetical protein
MSDFATFHERTLGDLLVSERQIRATLEDERQRFIQLLTRLAREYDGPRFESLRRDDPSVPKFWTSGDWEAFFATPRPQPETSTTWAGQKANGNTTDNGHIPVLGHMEQEIRLLRDEIRQLLAALSSSAPSQPTPNTAIIAKPPSSKPPIKTQPKAPAAEKKPPQAPKPPTEKTAQPETKQLADSSLLTDFLEPGVPLKYQKVVGVGARWSDKVWRRAAMILYLLATTGYNAHVELDRHIALTEGISFRSNSTKKPVYQLTDAGMMVAQTLELTRNAETFRLWIFRLSESGKELCRALGWEPVESEWERLLRLHQGDTQQEHALAVMYFAMMARARGYTVTVMPEEAAGKTPPDARVVRGNEKRLVEIELGERDETAKWRNLYEAQGFAALCAVETAGRERLAGDCKLAKIPGVATDLLTLKRAASLHEASDCPLWVETWK